MFRFSIRDVLLTTVIAGLALGWWLDHRSQATRLGIAGENVAKLSSLARQMGIKPVVGENGRVWFTSTNIVPGSDLDRSMKEADAKWGREHMPSNP